MEQLLTSSVEQLRVNLTRTQMLIEHLVKPTLTTEDTNFLCAQVNTTNAALETFCEKVQHIVNAMSSSDVGDTNNEDTVGISECKAVEVEEAGVRVSNASSLVDLLPEVKEEIFKLLSWTSLRNLSLTNRQLYEEVTPLLETSK